MSASDSAGSDPVLETLLDIRTVFDPDSTLASTLQSALGHDGGSLVVAWVALPEPDGGLVIEHVLGERTDALAHLDVSPGQGLTGRVYERTGVHWVNEYIAADSITHEFDAIIEAERIQRMIAAPLLVDDSVLGVLSVGRRDPGAFGDAMVTNVERLAHQASLALGIARTARANAAAAAVAERRRLSEELHDGVGALLFSLGTRTERLRRHIGNAELANEITRLQDELEQVGTMVRSLVTQWHASASGDARAEVQVIVEDFEARSGIRAVSVFLGPTPPLDVARMQAMTRFVGVALSNVERHAAATQVSVTVSAVPGQLAVAVFNDGPAPKDVVPGVGLGGAEARIARLGGTLTHVSDADGFTVRARIPL